ncbi:hypothetical protein [Anaerorhabdus furcosa]|uniref:Lipoprotein n=1 Tax=Anaerorhabdus furcosa TaxID=118967 RepID=A0A1T4KC10_9FIRM|nr:hypothetical protein [Anaerorhabdus furcosa]SJZ39959.1 hypothetical protein SAMN02745191_0466 [Anaerorhabdus furcosa]
MKKIFLILISLFLILGCSSPRKEKTEAVFEEIPIQYINNHDKLNFDIGDVSPLVKVKITSTNSIELTKEDIEVIMDMANCKAGNTECEIILGYQYLNDVICSDCLVEIEPKSLKLAIK